MLPRSCVLLALSSFALARCAICDDLILETPYVAQENNRLCQSAAIQILIQSITGKTIEQRTIQHELERRGGYLLHKSRIEYAKEILSDYDVRMRYETNEDTAWTEVIDQLRRKIPVVISTRLTESGHVLVAIGAMVKNGRRVLVVHDPWGEFDFESRQYVKGRGASVHYPFGELRIRNRIVEIGGRSVNQRYFTGGNRWLDVSDGETPPENVKRDVADWEYLQIRKATHRNVSRGE